MSDGLIGFAFGIFIGAFIGVFTLALCVAGRNN